MSVVGVGLASWLGAVSASGWSRILRELDRTVRRAAASSPTGRVTLVGHSAGGVVSRLYLSPEPFRGESFGGLDRVSRLVSLGSPHAGIAASPMRRFVHERYPGAFFAPRVAYVSVAGRAVRGDRRARSRSAWPPGPTPASAATRAPGATGSCPCPARFSRAPGTSSSTAWATRLRGAGPGTARRGSFGSGGPPSRRTPPRGGVMRWLPRPDGTIYVLLPWSEWMLLMPASPIAHLSDPAQGRNLNFITWASFSGRSANARNEE